MPSLSNHLSLKRNDLKNIIYSITGTPEMPVEPTAFAVFVAGKHGK